jgi:pectate lyase
VGRQTLRDGDGWAAAGAGTTGGSAAAPTQVHIVRSLADLVTALGGNNVANRFNDTPKVVFLDGVIDGFEDADGGKLTCDAWADPEYDFDEYLTAYHPDVWGWDEDPHGPLEDARVRSRRNQQAHMEINVGPNTTLIGLPGATLKHLSLMVDSADNVIVRNLAFEDAHDCFPRWRPTDGEFGNWNSEYDNMSIRRSSNVWVDSNTFSHSAEDLPEFFGRKYEIWDGQLDITHTSDRVTVSGNVFRDGDKLMLIGSTNNPAGGDPGRLNVTLRHNVFDGIGQRAPRMRFGQIDVYNNYFKVAVSAEAYEFAYLWGVGVESQGYYENNYVDLRGSDVDPSEIIYDWGGSAITEIGTWVRTDDRRGIGRPMSLLDAFNAVNDPALGDDAGWTPQLRRGPVLPAVAVPAVVSQLAGSGSLARLLATGGEPVPPDSGTAPDPDPTEPPESVWTSVDVDSPARPANGQSVVGEAGDAVTITSHGRFESADQAFHFVYASVEGDFTITARVDELDWGALQNTTARAGVLLTPDRTAVGTDFVYGGAMLRGSGDYRRTDRLSAGATAATSEVEVTGDGETYVQLTRTGDRYQAAFSLDGGETWEVASPRTFGAGLPDTVDVGLAVASGSDAISATATFSDVRIVDGDGNPIVIEVIAS